MEPEKIVLNARTRFRSVGEDGVILNLDSGRVLVVNDVGLRVLEILQEPTTAESVTQLITQEYEVSGEQALSDLNSYLAQLDSEHVITTQ